MSRAEPRARVAARLVATGLALVGAFVGLGGCGVSTDEGFSAIAEEEIPFGLAETSSSTTGTSTTTTVSEPPTSLVPSTTTTEPPVEGVILYFATENGLVDVFRYLERPVDFDAVVTALVAGPQPGETAAKARSIIGRDDIKQIDIRGGVATVALVEGFSNLPVQEQRLAVAQLVLTLTDRPGIGQVLFTVAGQPVDVPRADGSLARTTVSEDDYKPLLVTTTTTTVPTATTLATATTGSSTTTSEP